jgi:phage tail-like protein
MARSDPFRNFRFRLEIDGLQTAGFSQVERLATTTEVIEYRDGTDPRHSPTPSPLTNDNITLAQGMTKSLELYKWHWQIVSGQLTGHRRQVVIVVQDERRRSGAVRREGGLAGQVRRERPKRHGNEVLIELLRVNEG